MARSLEGEPLIAVYSSSYLRARQTAEPLARRRGLAVQTIDDLRERMLPPVPSRSGAKSWSDHFATFDYAPPGGEISRAAQARAVAAIRAIGARHVCGTVALRWLENS